MHLCAFHATIPAGRDIGSGMVWPLGYSKRFGIVHVNYATQQRTVEDSARWYSGVIASHGGVLSDPLPG